MTEDGYRAMYADARSNGIAPHYHYAKFGGRRVTLPVSGRYTVAITSAEYLDLYPDVRAASYDPRFHYAYHGQHEGRCPVK